MCLRCVCCGEPWCIDESTLQLFSGLILRSLYEPIWFRKGPVCTPCRKYLQCIHHIKDTRGHRDFQYFDLYANSLYHKKERLL